MNCWRTTWGATLVNMGHGFTMLAMGDATGISPIHTSFDKAQLGWLFLIGFVCTTIGTQWVGMSAADQSEVKHQLGLNNAGYPEEEEDTKENKP